ncbi:DUF4232 domain-containing protein [Naasia sp. SYSU D00948]|uniref:DUF4232 domain-containing protein n=1 Tax=Naasia sp. SYSU D00948 TaxID=2817379 RepID=UPI001B310BC1|nr:DUF4232 domain-containing protein [Naasia sp. SYSU D00948]
MRGSRGAAAVLGLAGALLLAGCAAGGGGTPTTSPTTSPTSPPTSAPPSTPTPSPTETGPADQCPDDALQITVGEGDPGAGNIGYDITFTNTGSAPCTLRGFPGVSVVGDGNGTQLGQPADRTDARVEDVRIAPGGTAVAPLQAVDIGSDGGPLGDECPTTTGDGWRIYPPHSFRAFFVESPGIAACTGSRPWLTVGPVRAG